MLPKNCGARIHLRPLYFSEKWVFIHFEVPVVIEKKLQPLFELQL